MKKLFFGFLLLVTQHCATTPKVASDRNTACDSVERAYRLARVKHAETLNKVTKRKNDGKEPDDTLDAQLQTDYRDWMAKLRISSKCLADNKISASSIPRKDDETVPELIADTTPAASEDDTGKDDKDKDDKDKDDKDKDDKTEE